MNRITANFKGKVQGVGFRYTVCRIAEQLPITGYVRNLPDGSVELVAEATEQVLSELMDAICSEMDNNIHEHTSDSCRPTGEFTAFRIAH